MIDIVVWLAEIGKRVLDAVPRSLYLRNGLSIRNFTIAVPLWRVA